MSACRFGDRNKGAGVWKIQGTQSLPSLEHEFHIPASEHSGKVSLAVRQSQVSAYVSHWIEEAQYQPCTVNSVQIASFFIWTACVSAKAMQSLPRMSLTVVVLNPTSYESCHDTRLSQAHLTILP